jgi:hypothetical protein
MIRFAAKLGLATFVAGMLMTGFAGADEGKGGKCTIAIKGDNAIVQACAKGGRDEAKKVMKDMVKQAKANGKKFTCDGCHKDLDNYELSKNAAEEFKKLEAAAKSK